MQLMCTYMYRNVQTFRWVLFCIPPGRRYLVGTLGYHLGYWGTYMYKGLSANSTWSAAHVLVNPADLPPADGPDRAPEAWAIEIGDLRALLHLVSARLRCGSLVKRGTCSIILSVSIANRLYMYSYCISCGCKHGLTGGELIR